VCRDASFGVFGGAVTSKRPWTEGVGAAGNLVLERESRWKRESVCGRARAGEERATCDGQSGGRPSWGPAANSW
jgi:hypothetical protein